MTPDGDVLPSGVTANANEDDGTVSLMIPSHDAHAERRGIIVDPDESVDVARDLVDAAAEANGDDDAVVYPAAGPLPNGLYLIAADGAPGRGRRRVGRRALLREALSEQAPEFVDGSTIHEHVFVVTDNYEPTVYTVAVDRDFAEAEKERFGGIVHEADVDKTRVDFDEEFPDHLPHDLSEGDAVRYVRAHGDDKPASVIDVRPDGYIDLVYPDGDEFREVHKVPPKHDGNDAGFEPKDDTE